MLRVKRSPLVFLAVFIAPFCVAQQSKPPLTLDEFFNAVDIRSVKISPDGRAVVVGTVRPDWDHNRFRSDLWLYRENRGGHDPLIPLTQSGHDSDPEWSPDGSWIAFLSDRAAEGKAADTEAKDRDGGDEDKSEKPVAQLYVISTDGGEAFALTSGKEEVHAFAWAADSKSLFFATREHWSKEQEEGYKKEWKDVVRFRESERGDAIWMVSIQAVLDHGPADEQKIGTSPQPALGSVALLGDRVKQLAVSPDGKRLAILTESRSQRWESLEAYAIYVTAARANPETGMQRPEFGSAIFDRIAWRLTGDTYFSPTSMVRLRAHMRTPSPVSTGRQPTARPGRTLVGRRDSKAPSPISLPCRTANCSRPVGWERRCSPTCKLIPPANSPSSPAWKAPMNTSPLPSIRRVWPLSIRRSKSQPRSISPKVRTS